jgi:hypothetical protein
MQDADKGESERTWKYTWKATNIRMKLFARDTKMNTSCRNVYKYNYQMLSTTHLLALLNYYSPTSTIMSQATKIGIQHHFVPTLMVTN